MDDAIRRLSVPLMPFLFNKALKVSDNVEKCCRHLTIHAALNEFVLRREPIEVVTERTDTVL
jgi:hypothetical protein